jgi:3-deoxy-D-manno-octulosonic-acid transferase
MFYFAYQLCVILFFIIWLPKGIYSLVTTGKYKESFFKRFGKGFPKRKNKDEEIIWCHAVSLGEVKALAPLVKELKEHLPEATIIVTTVTQTGQDEAVKQLGDIANVTYLPFDLPFVIRPIVKKVKPNIVILTETDFWWNFLDAAKNNQAKVFLVNGKISSTSYKRLLKLSFFARRLFYLVDKICLQSNLYKARFLGLEVHPKKILVTGNLKFDADVTELDLEAKKNLYAHLNIKESDPVIVLGSTHEEEEEFLLKSLLPIKETFPSLKIIIVPRHPQRFAEAKSVCEKLSCPYSSYSELQDSKTAEDVIVVDAMGCLMPLYQIATVAIVAGSFTNRVGGHNILEPLHYGTPVVFGPHMFSQPDLVLLAKEYQAGWQIKNKEVAQSILKLLKEPDFRHELGQKGKDLCLDLKGSVKKTLQCILSYS